jgi:phage gpG-like protein
MTPEEALKKLDGYLANLQKAQSMYVKVGLPKGQIGEKAYKPKPGQGQGINLIRNAAIHEYGMPPIPKRSFLRGVFETKQTEVTNFIAGQFELVFVKGKSAESALGLIGVFATNLSKGAFTTAGYGKWPALKQSTIDAKNGKSQPLIDSGLLRQSVTYEVGNDS